MRELRELYRIALTWTDGDPARAAVLVEAYCAGQALRPVFDRPAKP